ncbi:hypothetical protein QTP88_005877 [Uroleucon formosanum]
MTSFNSNRLRKILLSESSASIKAKVEMFEEHLWVHKLNKNRETVSEYHTLFSKQKKHPDKIFEHCLMDKETFNLVLDVIKDTIQKYRYLIWFQIGSFKKTAEANFSGSTNMVSGEFFKSDKSQENKLF